MLRNSVAHTQNFVLSSWAGIEKLCSASEYLVGGRMLAKLVELKAHQTSKAPSMTPDEPNTV